MDRIIPPDMLEDLGSGLLSDGSKQKKCVLLFHKTVCLAPWLYRVLDGWVEDGGVEARFNLSY